MPNLCYAALLMDIHSLFLTFHITSLTLTFSLTTNLILFDPLYVILYKQWPGNDLIVLNPITFKM